MRSDFKQTNLKGTIPSTVVNMVSTNQPMILATLRKLLDEDAKKNGRVPSDNLGDVPKFEGQRSLIKNLYLFLRKKNGT